MGKAIKAKVARRPRKAKKAKAGPQAPAMVVYEVWAVRPDWGTWGLDDVCDDPQEAFRHKDALEADGAKALVFRIDLPAVKGD